MAGACSTGTAGEISISLREAWEDQALQQVLRGTKTDLRDAIDLISDPEIAQYASELREFLGGIVKEGHLPDKLYLLIDDVMVPNAMILWSPQQRDVGVIWVSIGLLHALQVDDGLAYILRHEVEHQFSEYQKKVNELRAEGRSEAAALHSRPVENEVDARSLVYLHRNGYNPHVYEQVNRTFTQLRGSGLSLSHPMWGSRTDTSGFVLTAVKRELGEAVKPDEPAYYQREFVPRWKARLFTPARLAERRARLFAFLDSLESRIEKEFRKWLAPTVTRQGDYYRYQGQHENFFTFLKEVASEHERMLFGCLSPDEKIQLELELVYRLDALFERVRSRVLGANPRLTAPQQAELFGLDRRSYYEAEPVGLGRIFRYFELVQSLSNQIHEAQKQVTDVTLSDDRRAELESQIRSQTEARRRALEELRRLIRGTSTDPERSLALLEQNLKEGGQNPSAEWQTLIEELHVLSVRYGERDRVREIEGFKRYWAMPSKLDEFTHRSWSELEHLIARSQLIGLDSTEWRWIYLETLMNEGVRGLKQKAGDPERFGMIQGQVLASLLSDNGNTRAFASSLLEADARRLGRLYQSFLIKMIELSPRLKDLAPLYVPDMFTRAQVIAPTTVLQMRGGGSMHDLPGIDRTYSLREDLAREVYTSELEDAYYRKLVFTARAEIPAMELEDALQAIETLLFRRNALMQRSFSPLGGQHLQNLENCLEEVMKSLVLTARRYGQRHGLPLDEPKAALSFVLARVPELIPVLGSRLPISLTEFKSELRKLAAVPGAVEKIELLPVDDKVSLARGLNPAPLLEFALATESRESAYRFLHEIRAILCRRAVATPGALELEKTGGGSYNPGYFQFHAIPRGTDPRKHWMERLGWAAWLQKNYPNEGEMVLSLINPSFLGAEGEQRPKYALSGQVIGAHPGTEWYVKEYLPGVISVLTRRKDYLVQQHGFVRGISILLAELKPWETYEGYWKQIMPAVESWMQGELVGRLEVARDLTEAMKLFFIHAQGDARPASMQTRRMRAGKYISPAFLLKPLNEALALLESRWSLSLWLGRSEVETWAIRALISQLDVLGPMEDLDYAFERLWPLIEKRPEFAGIFMFPAWVGRLQYDHNRVKLAKWQLERRFGIAEAAAKVKSGTSPIPTQEHTRSLVRQIARWVAMQFEAKSGAANEVVGWLQSQLLTNVAETRLLGGLKLTRENWTDSDAVAAVDLPHLVNSFIPSGEDRYQLILYVLGARDELPGFLSRVAKTIAIDGTGPDGLNLASACKSLRAFFPQANVITRAFLLQPFLDSETGIGNDLPSLDKLITFMMGSNAGNSRLRKVFEIYLGNLPPGERKAFMGYILGSMTRMRTDSATRNVGVGQIANAMGPLGVVSGQAARTTGLVRQDLREEFDQFFDSALPPSREDVIDYFKRTFGVEIANIEIRQTVGSGSKNFVVLADFYPPRRAGERDARLRDEQVKPRRVVVRFLRDSTEGKVANEAWNWERTIQALEKEQDLTLQRFAGIANLILRDALETLKKGGVELDLELEVGNYERARDVYRGVGKRSGFGIDVGKPAFDLMSKIPLELRDRVAMYEYIPSTALKDVQPVSLQRALAGDIIESELRAIFGGKFSERSFDPDGHPGNWLIDLARRVIWRIDYARFTTVGATEVESLRQVLRLLLRPSLVSLSLPEVQQVMPWVFGLFAPGSGLEKVTAEQLRAILVSREMPGALKPQERLFFIQKLLTDRLGHPIDLHRGVRAMISSISRVMIFGERAGGLEFAKILHEVLGLELKPQEHAPELARAVLSAAELAARAQFERCRGLLESVAR